MTPEQPWSLVYADGSANVYRFDATATDVRFAYEPVTPAQSSTGRYRGGEPRQEILTHDDPRLERLWRHVAALEADRSHHATKRRKGDGALTVITTGGSRRLLVLRAATRELEAWLAQGFGCYHGGPP